MLLTAIFLVSFATLAFEVLLTRVFAIGQWNHLSFMVISIALFGFGASGTFLSVVETTRDRRFHHWASTTPISVLLFLFSTTEIISFLSLNFMPLDYFRLPVEPLQSLLLLAAYLLLALPFFFSGLIISTGYTTMPQKAGLVYFASMAGSALGAGIPIVALPLLNEGRLIMVSAAVALIPAVVAALRSLFIKKRDIPDHSLLQNLLLIGCLAIIVFAAVSLTKAIDPIIQVSPSPYKALGQILQFPETHIVESKSGIRGRVDRVQTPYIRFAPGLSLKYTDSLPGQQVIYRDGDSPLVLYDLKEKNDAGFAVFMLSFAGYYQTRHPQKVLLIQQGGGSAVPCAIASGADHISIIEPNRYVADLLRRQYSLTVINRDPRPFLAQEMQRYDVIHVDNWGASIPGTTALNQEHIFTVEAFGAYWKHLTPGGVLIISRKLLLPPSDSLRLWSTAYEALKNNAVKRPRDHLALLRNFDTFTLLVSKSPVDAKKIIEFTQQKNFDLVFLKNIPLGMANKFHVFKKPYYFQEINKLAGFYESGRQNDFFRKYLLDVKPQSDKRAFPGRYLKWSKVKTLYKSLGSRIYALFMSGEIVVTLVFIEALILSICLLVSPLVLITPHIQKPKLSQVAYFLGIGAGFMFVELYLIKCFTLIMGNPAISFTLVVSAILIFSSLGALWAHTKSDRNIRLALITLIGMLILTTAGVELLINPMLKASRVVRYLVALLLIFPTAFMMGWPFPLGMRNVLTNPLQRAYAWSVNGCASVLSSILAAQMAISFGIPMIAIGAILAYILAYWAIKPN
jgi:hypothetical protein